MIRRLAFLFSYLRKYRRKLAFGLSAILASVTIGLSAPLVVGRAVDTLRQEVSAQTLLGYGALLVAIALAQGVFTYAQRMILVTMSRDIEFDLRNRYYAQLLRLSPGYFQEHATGDLMARATNDLQAVRMLCGPAIMYSSNTLFVATGALFFMVRIHGPLTLLALSTMPLVAIATKVVGARIHVLFERVQESFSGLSTRAQENISGIRVVRAYAQEDGEREAFRKANRDYVERNRHLIRWTAAFHPLIQALVGVGFVAVLWYGGLLVTRGAVTVGQFVTFTFFLTKLIWPMVAIGWVINLVQRGTASLGRIRRVLEEPPEITEDVAVSDPGPLEGAVAFRGLDFAYPAAGPRRLEPVAEAASPEGAESTESAAEPSRAAVSPVLEGIDLAVPAGSTVAVVGRTGAGKSTLLSLVPRLIDPPPGTLAIDSIDVRRIPLRRLRDAVAMVPQESFLFSATLRDNIAFGRPDAAAEEVDRAAELAGLHEDLESFPKGLETLVGERGITLSGGQKQRVALARALLCDPRILLLDDCLSAVDTQTEERILQNLRQVFEGRTVFLVAHRISTVQSADLILVLEHGRIVDRGTHEELIARGGLYADLHQRQLLEDELAAVS